jgi:protein TonB
MQAQPQLEEIPEDPEEPKETDAPPVMPVPLLKANMVSREVPVRTTGIPPEKNGLERQLFNEETTSVLVAETCGVIRLSAAVTPGQLLVLANPETKREVIVQVVRKRAYKPTMCYVELEFVEAAPRFWGMEFSAATALLPKNDQDVETAAMVITAEATGDQPWILPTAPDAGEVQTFKREVEELRGNRILTETPGMSEEARAVAQLSVEVAKAAPIGGPGDGLSTESILNSGVDAAGAAPPPLEREQVLARWKSAAQEETPQPGNDFSKSSTKSKRWRPGGGSFTPEFRRGAVRMAFLVGALGVATVGVAWFKNWGPWKKHPASASTRVASDAPVTSAAIPANSASVSNAGAPALADGIEAPVKGNLSSGPVAQPTLKKNTSGGTTAGKPSLVRPAAKPASNPEVTSGKESDVVPPKLIQAARAVASLEALRDFERGNVVIDAVVGTSGEVHFISVISGPPSLRDAAVESLKQYKYEPATRNGQPVPAHVTISIHFRYEP